MTPITIKPGIKANINDIVYIYNNVAYPSKINDEYIKGVVQKISKNGKEGLVLKTK